MPISTQTLLGKRGEIPLKVGYIRISTTDQNTARQEVLMQELQVEQVYIDRMSGLLFQQIFDSLRRRKARCLGKAQEPGAYGGA